MLGEFGGYIGANAEWIPNYGERYRYGEAISNVFVESAVNQVASKRMVKKQQMRWSPRGAHLLLQIRTRVLNDDLAEPSAAGTQPSCRRQTHGTWLRDLPWFVPLSKVVGLAEEPGTQRPNPAGMPLQTTMPSTACGRT